MANLRYEEFLARARREHGEKFSDEGLAPEFVRYFQNGHRVRVRFSYGEELTGTISATTGWRPSFLLMRRSSDSGSQWVLGPDDHVVAIKRGRKYEPLTQSV